MCLELCLTHKTLSIFEAKKESQIHRIVYNMKSELYSGGKKMDASINTADNLLSSWEENTT